MFLLLVNLLFPILHHHDDSAFHVVVHNPVFCMIAERVGSVDVIMTGLRWIFIK